MRGSIGDPLVSPLLDGTELQPTPSATHLLRPAASLASGYDLTASSPIELSPNLSALSRENSFGSGRPTRLSLEDDAHPSISAPASFKRRSERLSSSLEQTTVLGLSSSLLPSLTSPESGGVLDPFRLVREGLAPKVGQQSAQCTIALTPSSSSTSPSAFRNSGRTPPAALAKGTSSLHQSRQRAAQEWRIRHGSGRQLISTAAADLVGVPSPSPPSASRPASAKDPSPRTRRAPSKSEVQAAAASSALSQRPLGSRGNLTKAAAGPPAVSKSALTERAIYSIGEGDEGRCRQIDALAKRLGGELPKMGDWFTMLCDVLEHAPQAVIAVDMKVPGLPMAYVNPAMEALTGYTKRQLEGHNCRMLQGPRTEAASVAKMVEAIRSGVQTTLCVTNYRHDGHEFINVLTLHPVRDSKRVYRYCLGVLGDKEDGDRDHAARAALLPFLPVNFNDSLQTGRAPVSHVSHKQQLAQSEEWRPLLVKFARLLWSMDWMGSLQLLITNPEGIALFAEWLADSPSRQLRDDALTLEFVQLIHQVQRHPERHYGVHAIKLCSRLLGEEHSKGEMALQAVCEHYARDLSALSTMASAAFPHLANLRAVEDAALSVLAADAFPKFVLSKACLPLVEKLISIADEDSVQTLLWHSYKVPSDVAGWVRSFVSIAELFPACIVLSDMAMSGNPMFFVNREFCRITGYDKDEAHGRNCRFLQGPRTEPQAVAYIQDSLRRGVDCHVRITNYRKGGEMFTNLLTMRPVHDSNGVYRFCIGLQFEVTDEPTAKEKLPLLDKLLQLLPTTIEVASTVRVGPVHHRQTTREEESTAVAIKLESALNGLPIAPKPERSAYQSVESFGQNYAVHLKDIGMALGRCPHVDALARLIQVEPPTAGPWLQMLCDVLEHAPQAVIAVDMKVPGLPMAYVNPAMEALTGYTKRQLEGHNCRMLQGPRTEAASVAKMVEAIRSGVQTTLCVTNYRHDGHEFINVLTLHPVRDSTGVYRYCLGVLCDMARGEQERKRIATLSTALPHQFNVSLQAQKLRRGAPDSVDPEQQRKQWLLSLALFTRLLWSLDWEAAIRQIVTHNECFPMLSTWLLANAPNEAPLFELIVVVAELEKSDKQQFRKKALELARMYLDEIHSSSADAVESLHNQQSIALSALAAGAFPRFAQSSASLQVIKKLLRTQELQEASAANTNEFIWSGYSVPPDVTGWLHSFVSVAETITACIVISDMFIPGNPMVFVNREFCRVTGYSKDEAHGRNCRFLQGPRTEPSSVAMIQDSLRRGADCIVRITNYRKSGEMFENLLTMRPVHDSNGVYRFCIGVQFEVVDEASSKVQLDKLVKLVKLMPSTVEVSGPPVGPVHQLSPTEEEASTELAVRFENALAAKPTAAPAATTAAASVETYGRNHSIEITRLGIRVDRCEHVDDLARKFGAPPPYAGPWLQMLCEVLEAAPVAMTVVNMQEPGLPMVYCTPAMEALTGYTRQQLLGSNCRMLQGQATEPEAVAKMVDAIRRAVPTAVSVTNYRADGAVFINELTLHPVRDSTGVYRYSIGVLAEGSGADESAADHAQVKAISKMRKALPSNFDASLPETVGLIKPSETQLPTELLALQRRRWAASLSPLTRHQWCRDHERDAAALLRRIITLPECASSFGRWLHQLGSAEQVTAFERLVKVHHVLLDSHHLSGSAAIDVCREVLDKLFASGGTAKEKLVGFYESAEPYAVLAPASRAFVHSWAFGTLIEKAMDSPQDEDDLKGLLWNDYSLSSDVGGWVSWLASVAEQLPFCLVLSDMTLPSCPMIFVNSRFCQMAGYTQAEAHGRSCRFLQGPRTEPSSVTILVDSLRRGVGCHVKITNYRKNGAQFTNLLSLCPVHDSNGVYRFCIGVQLEVVDAASTSPESLAALAELLSLLPNTIDVVGRPIGPVHHRGPPVHESGVSISERLERALVGASSEVAPSGVPRLVDCFANNHAALLQELGTGAAPHNTLVGGITADGPVAVRPESRRSPSRTPISVRELREMLVAPAADPQLQAMASALGLKLPTTGASWIEQLRLLADQLPHAMIAVDMADGVTIEFVNQAFEQLTQYTSSESKGRNCKFLQGVRTEPMAIRRICQAIQREKQETLRVTNYRKDGSTFKNILTVHPVHDCSGTYRYSIGVLADDAHEAEEAFSLAKLRGALPTMIDHLQSMLSDERVMNSAHNFDAAAPNGPRARSFAQRPQRDSSSHARHSSRGRRSSGSTTPRPTGTSSGPGSTAGRASSASRVAARRRAASERERDAHSKDGHSKDGSSSWKSLKAASREASREGARERTSAASRASVSSRGSSRRASHDSSEEGSASVVTHTPGASTPPYTSGMVTPEEFAPPSTPRFTDGDGTPRYVDPRHEWLTPAQERWEMVRGQREWITMREAAIDKAGWHWDQLRDHVRGNTFPAVLQTPMQQEVAPPVW